MNIINFISFKLVDFINKINIRAKLYEISMYPNIDKTVKIGVNCVFQGPKSNIIIKKNTYINEVMFDVGNESTIKIGSNCAIGYRVSIKARTHKKDSPTLSNDGKIQHEEQSIFIGDNCWIGDNVYIREGVVLGDNVTVGANSVVTKSFRNNVVIAGIPARIIKER